ncbi:hypothetical protein [Kitasatospora cinereorecta]|uniref:Uncharacterized protein n=1 Tax=Kitasatospora cinereorecta TaxID=285560 RepID=A0ABW0VDM9_9ACTN
MRQLTFYLQSFLAGDARTDLGDYQEMGLSAAEAQALRALRSRATAAASEAQLPSGWAAVQARASCDAIARAEATASAKPPGWP